MTISPHKKTSIALGNRLYVEGNYEQALMVYQGVATSQPALTRFIQGNIQLCEKKLKLCQTIPLRTSAEPIKPGSISDWLLQPLANVAVDGDIPPNSVVLKLLESTKTEKLTPDHLAAAVQCALSSPFQRDLLWYLASIIHNMGVTDILKKAPQDVVTLAALVNAASDYTYWLMNRITLQQQIGNLYQHDPFAWDLLNLPPDNLSFNRLTLPPYKKREARYGWCAPSTPSLHSKHQRTLSISFGTILLNEKKFIGLNLLQHYRMCESWALVEGACQGYPARKVSEAGLSLDNCATQIRIFPDPQHKLHYIQHGWTVCTGEDAKSELRNRYLQHCDSDFLLVIDADEFYIPEHISAVMQEFENSNIHAIVLPQVHFWKSTDQFITGEYYDISHTRLYRHHRGMAYIRNHNFPEIGGKYIHEMGQIKFSRTIKEVAKAEGTFTYLEPRCNHMGFAKDFDDMRDKSDYYINRGEVITRKATTQSRAAWFDDSMPEKCKLRCWGGELPETLQYNFGAKS